MNLTLSRLHAEIAGAVLAVVIGGIALHEHDQHVREKAVSDAVQVAQSTYQKQLATLSANFDAKMKERDAAYKQQLETLNSKFQTATTPVQIAQLVSQLMGLKSPIQITTPAATPQNPNPQPVAQVMLEDAPQVKTYLHTCEECKLELPKLQADLKDREAQQTLAQKQIDSLKQQRDTALTAARGGTTWQRTWKVVKYLVIGGAIGYAAGKKF